MATRQQLYTAPGLPSPPPPQKDTSVLPLLVIASDTILIPRAVASDLERIA
jgi:hypothetical protein